MARTGGQARTSWIRSRGASLRAGVLAIVLCTGVFAADGKNEPTREFQIKAAFLYNFAQFVEWPPRTFASAESPLVIGVLGLDPFGGFLDDLVKGERVNGRALVIQRYRDIGDIGACHVLFVSGSEGHRIEEIAEYLKGRSILTVCDWEAYARQGAIVWFVMERNRVRLRINLDAAKAAGLTISSKLLRSAETVTLTQRE